MTDMDVELLFSFQVLGLPKPMLGRLIAKMKRLLKRSSPLWALSVGMPHHYSLFQFPLNQLPFLWPPPTMLKNEWQEIFKYNKSQQFENWISPIRLFVLQLQNSAVKKIDDFLYYARSMLILMHVVDSQAYLLAWIWKQKKPDDIGRITRGGSVSEQVAAGFDYAHHRGWREWWDLGGVEIEVSESASRNSYEREWTSCAAASTWRSPPNGRLTGEWAGSSEIEVEIFLGVFENSWQGVEQCQVGFTTVKPPNEENGDWGEVLEIEVAIGELCSRNSWKSGTVCRLASEQKNIAQPSGREKGVDWAGDRNSEVVGSVRDSVKGVNMCAVASNLCSATEWRVMEIASLPAAESKSRLVGEWFGELMIREWRVQCFELCSATNEEEWRLSGVRKIEFWWWVFGELIEREVNSVAQWLRLCSATWMKSMRLAWPCRGSRNRSWFGSVSRTHEREVNSVAVCFDYGQATEVREWRLSPACGWSRNRSWVENISYKSFRR